jgi:geranylgeranyl transferase type-2 subunit beta
MSLVSGPGRGGMASMPDEMRLLVDKHVRYIQSLDTVRTLSS